MSPLGKSHGENYIGVSRATGHPARGVGPRTKSRVKRNREVPETGYMTPPAGATEPEGFGGVRCSAIAWQVLPGMVFPGLIYFLVSRSASVVVALAAASSVPLIDAVVRLVRRRP